MDSEAFSVDEKSYEKVEFQEAENLCKANNKRLCSPEEFTFACEGENMLPYVTGFERPTWQCNFTGDDKVNGYPYCKSTFGIHNMTGTHNEWTKTTTAHLSGGFSFAKPMQCRSSFVAQSHVINKLKKEFRCCKDLP